MEDIRENAVMYGTVALVMVNACIPASYANEVPNIFMEAQVVLN